MTLALAAAFLVPTAALAAARIDIRDFGAIGDGVTVNTAAIQRAIDACTARGGEVVVAEGRFVTGTIHLKSNVTLHLAPGAALLGSTDIADYATDTHKNMYKNEPHMDRCLIFARDAHNFGVTGGGVIDGRGGRDNFPNKADRAKHRPMLIRFLECESIRIRDVTLRDPAAWTTAFLYCRDIVVDGITISSRANNNGDGLDFDGCTDVRVSNSSFDTSDDSICLQASRPDRPCAKITITNCTFESKWAGMRIGLLSRGDFEAVTVSNCTFTNIQDSGLKIQLNEGGSMRNMVFTNLAMKNVPRPVFMTFCQQRACVDAPEEMYPMAEMRDFVFSNITVDNRALDKNTAFFFTGLPEGRIRNVSLSNIRMAVAGGGTSEDASRTIKEYTLETLAGWWPEFHLVGTLPASGLFARHMDGLNISGFHLELAGDDARPPLVFDDVTFGTVSDSTANHRTITGTHYSP